MQKYLFKNAILGFIPKRSTPAVQNQPEGSSVIEKALRKLSGGVKKKKKSKKKKKEVDEMEEWWHLGRQTSCDERKKGWKLLGVKKSGSTYFVAIIYPDGRLVRLGTYTSSKLAAMAYDQESLKIYDLQKPLNFPHRVIIGTPPEPMPTNTTTEPNVIDCQLYG
ncbi:putative transcription factor AP2-EREBP family [Helianthus anomalus]